MGTHISRVKSVDLDAWTDEQLQSMLRWGNARANKYVIHVISGTIHLSFGRYWEAKLADGHIPSEALVCDQQGFDVSGLTSNSKIENFIRTKYESKRWVMEGGLPDPATLDVGEDESSVISIPLPLKSSLT